MTSKFPTQDLLPKTETNVTTFLQKYPQYDGKDIIIGILDTGVDPGAIGLSIIPNGEKKIIHIADCTGSGDVKMDTDAMAKKDPRGWVIEKDIFGKALVLNGDLNLQPFPRENDGEDSSSAKAVMEEEKEVEEGMPVRLAFKRAYELFPGKLTNRVKRHYAQEFDKEQHRHAASVHKELAEWNVKYAAGQPTKDQIRQKEDIAARLDVLDGKIPASDPLKEDPGPLYQIILFYDGTNYRVIVDTESSGDLSALPTDRAMTDYHKEFQFARFSEIDMMNYCVNIYQEGKIVSVVVDAGAHGSHVAGITSRYHPADKENDEEPNGVAPSAKIVALKIGDTRLGSMETGTAMTRAMIEAVKYKCDVINLSYGEGCVLPNSGRFVELAEQLVYKHGIVFVSSAGNNGPALSTVGAPGGTTDAIISVAAYVSPAMMRAEYSMEPTSSGEENTGTTYTWSSVGPTSDGAMGVDITAPGAAITCVPNWCLQRNQLMNGTSMSSPNATGCVALLLSAAKAEGINLTPARLKRALGNTAQKMPGLSSLQQGFGMVDVEAAWEYIKTHKDDPYEDVNFKVAILNRPGAPRGVYLRHAKEVAAKQSFSVEVDPIFSTNDNVDAETQMKRVGFEMKIQLKATESFVDVPEFFMLMHNGRSFKFEVDPTKLDPGVHTAFIYGYDTTKPELGPRFHIPITIAKPIDEDVSISLGELEFAPNEVKRFFLNVPSGATWMDVAVKDTRTIETDEETSSRLLVLHTLQLLPNAAYRDAEEQKYLNLMPSHETVASIPVHSGVTCEMDLARYWSAQGATKVTASIRFRGVTSVPDSLTMLCGGGGTQVRLHSSLADEFILPKATLKTWLRPLSPLKAGLIAPCDERDVLTSNGKQIHQLVLEYEFEQKEAGSFTPRAPALQGVLYEAAFESQMMLIFDEDKRVIGVADSWPGEIKAPKGKITIRMQIRHDDNAKLELLKNLTIMIERKLGKEINLSAYKSRETMVTAGDKMRRSLIRQGTVSSVFFGEPEVPTDCQCGDILRGSATFEDRSAKLEGASKRPGGTEIKYIVGSKAKEEKEDKAKALEAQDTRTDDEKMAEVIRSAKLEFLKKLSEKKEDTEKFIALYQTLVTDYPAHLPLLVEGLKFHDNKDRRKDNLGDVILAADDVIKAVDEIALAGHFGVTHDDEDAESCKIHKDNEEKKGFLIEALARKAHAIADASSADPTSDGFGQTLKHLQKWADTSSKKYSVLTLERETRDGFLGSRLKLLTELLEKKGDDTKDSFAPMTKADILEERKRVLEALSFTHLKERQEKWSIITSNKDYAPF